MIGDFDINDNYYHLFIIDELFSGTNTKERILANCKLLNSLDSKNNIVMATTHDSEVSTYLSKMNFSSFYFNETIKNNDIHFDYILKKGILTKGNAIEILKLYNLPI